MKSLLLVLALVLPAAGLLVACGSRESAAEPAKPVTPAGGAPRSALAPANAPAPKSAPAYDLKLGEAVFTSTCLGCHGKGVYDAPVLGNAADWEPRVTQDLDTLVEHAINGHGRMPPKGGFFTLTNLEVASAVAYAVDKSKKIILAQKQEHAAKACHPVKNPDNCTKEELKEVLTLHMLWLLGGKEQ
jgi:cytochrome c5